MITVIIKGTKNIDTTVQSLSSNSNEKFRVFVDAGYNEKDKLKYLPTQYPHIEFEKSRLFRKYGKISDLYWSIPSGCLILTASWNLRIDMARNSTSAKVFCLLPAGKEYYFITNRQDNVGRWKGPIHIIPILQVTEV